MIFMVFPFGPVSPVKPNQSIASGLNRFRTRVLLCCSCVGGLPGPVACRSDVSDSLELAEYAGVPSPVRAAGGGSWKAPTWPAHPLQGRALYVAR